MPLHILQLGPYPPPVGGISRNMLAIRDEALARGHRCSIVATSRSSRVENEPHVYHPASAFGLIKLLGSLKYDILHLHIGGDVSPRVLSLAMAAAIFGRNRSVLTLHSGAYPRTREGLAAAPNSIRGMILRRFSKIIAVNAPIADVFRRYGIAGENIHTILPYSLKRPDERVAIPTALADFCKAHSPLMLAVGGLEKDYDPLFQIAVMKDVLREFPNAGLMIVGDGSLQSEVERAAAKSGYADHISIAGNIDHAVTLHMINDADILLRTTLFDGDAISIREALFMGTPVIATDDGMRPDGVHLIEIGDAKGLLEKVKTAVAGGKQNAVGVGSDDSNISEVVDIYERMAG